jgi:hypothetical protein
MISCHSLKHLKISRSGSSSQRWSDALEEKVIPFIYECRFKEGFNPKWGIQSGYGQHNVFYTRYFSTLKFNESIPIQVRLIACVDCSEGNSSEVFQEKLDVWKIFCIQKIRVFIFIGVT